ncbi:MAG: hypothetical protein ACUVTL_02455 [Thermoproteota archaeon]
MPVAIWERKLIKFINADTFFRTKRAHAIRTPIWQRAKNVITKVMDVITIA